MPGSLFSRILPSLPPSTLETILPRWRARLSSFLPSSPSSSSSPRFLGGGGQDSVGNDIPRAALEIRAMEAGLGPLSFLLSWYCVGLVCMGLLFNRIHHIVRPPPPSFHRSQLQALRAHQHSTAASRAHHPSSSSSSSSHNNFNDPPPPPPLSFFQHALNLGKRALVSPITRKLMRIPSTVLLFRVLFQLGIVLAQSVGYGGGWLAGGTVWEGMKAMEMEELCWRTFACVCFALVVGSIGRGLEGTAQLGTGFNLFGFAFLLHLYSSPLTHLGPSRGSKDAGGEAGPYRASRPDSNVLFGITLAVLELSWIHANEMSNRLARMRLLPTTVCGLIGLTHFTITLFRSPTRLPSFTFLTNLLSLLLLVVIGLTVALNAFTQLLTLGTIFPDQLLPHESVWPRWNEEFSLALLKAGTACMESSKLGGLGNEVALIELPAQSYITLSSSSSNDLLEPPPSSAPSPFASSSSPVHIHQSASPTRGFGNLIPRVHPSSHAPGTPSPNDAETPWWKAARRFARALGRWFLGLGWAILGKIPGGRTVWRLGVDTGRWVGGFRWSWRGVRWRRRGEGEVGMVVGVEGLDDWEEEEEGEGGDDAFGGGEEMETEVERVARLNEQEYERFVRGGEEYPEESNEVDDPSFSYNIPSTATSSRPRSYSHSSSNSNSSSSSSSFHAEEDEPLSFYSHLPPSPTLPQTVLLAHMTSTSSSPLTRRRYASLLAPTSPPRDDSLASVVRERRRSSVGGAGGAGRMMQVERAEEDQWEEERRRMCVVCVSEEREVILWPCACLALCDGCRSNLATRVNAGSHSCPCCRTKVEGYSRIFIP